MENLKSKGFFFERNEQIFLHEMSLINKIKKTAKEKARKVGNYLESATKPNKIFRINGRKYKAKKLIGEGHLSHVYHVLFF